MEEAEAFVLNEKGALCAPGCEGEIYVRTPHRFLGYFRDAAATQEVFVPNPLTRDSHDIVYKAGDLALIDEWDDFQFLGRKALQVKSNGSRLDLDEVQNAILSAPTVRDCAVVMRPGGAQNNLIAKDSAVFAAPDDVPEIRPSSICWRCKAGASFLALQQDAIQTKQRSIHYRHAYPDAGRRW